MWLIVNVCVLDTLPCQVWKPVLFLSMVKACLLPSSCLEFAFFPSHVSFCKSVENVKVVGAERACMLEDAWSQGELLCELKNILGDDFSVQICKNKNNLLD